MTMAAASVRGGMVIAATEADPLKVAVRTDAVMQRMKFDAVGGSNGGELAATESEFSRVWVMFGKLARLPP